MDYATFDNNVWKHTRKDYESLPAAKKQMLDEKAGGNSLARRPIVYVGEGTKWTETVEPTRVLRERFTPPPPPPTEVKYASAVQAHIDATAATKGYGDGYAAASYSSSTTPGWAAEADAFIAWRDSVWVYVFAQLSEVQAQKRSQPTVSELVAELPSIIWPQDNKP